MDHLCGAENYSAWKWKMEDVLEELELLSYVKGEVTEPQESNAKDHQNWKKKQQKALRVIRSRVAEKVANTLAVAETGMQAWNILKNLLKVHVDHLLS
jgi:hypothetical protein